MDSEKISFDVQHPGAGLCLTVKVDDHVVWQCDREFSGPVTVAVPEQDGDHCLEFSMAGKESHHTQLSLDGQILSDVRIAISDICIDNININYLVYSLAVYQHDFNGTQALQTDKFYGQIGCNGSIKFKFSTPIYLWLLEHI